MHLWSNKEDLYPTLIYKVNMKFYISMHILLYGQWDTRPVNPKTLAPPLPKSFRPEMGSKLEVAPISQSLFPGFFPIISKRILTFHRRNTLGRITFKNICKVSSWHFHVYFILFLVYINYICYISRTFLRPPLSFPPSLFYTHTMYFDHL